MTAPSNNCRACAHPLSRSFVDLGMSPPSNAFLKPSQCNAMESFFPLHAYVCDRCWLVQLAQFQAPESIFGNYAYFSSFSESWLDHARRYVDMMVDRFQLSSVSQVVELGSNDGYLLKNFIAKEIPVLGVEPARNIAETANKAGIRTLNKFFNSGTAKELVSAGTTADLILLNNTLAQIPDVHDFVVGIRLLLKKDGIFTIEFPHLLRLMEENQFDTIYHEHFSYFSLLSVEFIIAKHGLALFDAEELPTHGGSLRIFGARTDGSSREASERLRLLRAREHEAGLDTSEAYRDFSEKVKTTKRAILELLISLKNENKRIVGYGAAAKGNTLLNYCGIREDFFDFTVDLNPHKQGLFLPGTHIPIHSPEKLRETKPDYVFILPWNLKKEIVSQLAYIREWGGKFIVPIPTPEVL